MQKTILVLGATGTLGRPVAYALNNAGFKVRIMTRDLKKALKIFNDSFEKIAGNPTDTTCLEEALNGCYGVHISLTPEIELQVVEAVIKVAKMRGVERITYISGASVAEETRWFPMINQKFLAEQALKESGIHYAIFCPTWIMDTLPMFVNQGQASILGKQPHPYHWVAAEDVGRMVTSIYELEEASKKRIIVHGPELISAHEALKRYCTAFHPEIKKISSTPFWLVKLLATITNNQELKGAIEMMAYFEKYGEGSNLPQANGVPAPTTTLDMWIQKRKVNENQSLNNS
ncbi:MAG: NmrA family NAD(P)-binding protein [Anaerolineales bacterium]|nr:NmrA family NAD(P)-binding protein [Anaerolineales bacterium]